jgi:thioredoxin reductase
MAGSLYDLIIVGGGPAGLSAALAAARACRSCLVLDSGTPRNAVAVALHNFITCDGITLEAFRNQARAEISAYPGVDFAACTVERIEGAVGNFSIVCAGNQSFSARRVLLTVGLVDHLPEIPGLAPLWGRGIYHCPYCDGCEHLNTPWGLLVVDTKSYRQALFLHGLNSSLTVYTNGAVPSRKIATRLKARGIAIEKRPIASLEAQNGSLAALIFEDGERAPLTVLWLRQRQSQTRLIQELGLTCDAEQCLLRNKHGQTSIKGIYAAGDLCAGATQQTIWAAADGSRVASSILNSILCG